MNGKEYVIEALPPNGLAVEIRVANHLEPTDRDRVVDFVTFAGRFDPKNITRAAGRNVFFPIEASAGIYDTIQVSGAGFFDIGITDNSTPLVMYEENKSVPITPPKVNSQEFEHITTIVIDGEITQLKQTCPMGSYTEKAAEEKFENTKRAMNLVESSDLSFFCPIPAYLVKYRDIPDNKGGKQSAIVYCCPSGGKRAEQLASEILNQALRTQVTEKREGYITDQFLHVLYPLLKAMGKTASILHGLDLCHYQMTLGNVSQPLTHPTKATSLCLYDWETLRQIDSVDPKLARAYDMSVTIGSFASLVKGYTATLNLSDTTVFNLGYGGLLCYLNGYTGLVVNELVHEVGLTPEKSTSLLFSTNQNLVRGVISLIPSLDRNTK